MTGRPKPTPRFEVRLTARAELLDDRLQQLTDEALRELMRQTSAYIRVSLEQQLLDRLSKHLPANLAQFALGVFMEELEHIYLHTTPPKLEVVDHEAPVPLLPDARVAELEGVEAEPTPSKQLPLLIDDATFDLD